MTQSQPCLVRRASACRKPSGRKHGPGLSTWVRGAKGRAKGRGGRRECREIAEEKRFWVEEVHEVTLSGKVRKRTVCGVGLTVGEERIYTLVNMGK